MDYLNIHQINQFPHTELTKFSILTIGCELAAKYLNYCY